jgi:hypothetical protein
MKDGGKYIYQYVDENNSLIDSIELTNDSCSPIGSLPAHDTLAAFFGADLPTLNSRSISRKILGDAPAATVEVWTRPGASALGSDIAAKR